MTKWKIECVNKFTEIETTKTVRAKSKSKAIKQVHDQGYLIGACVEVTEQVQQSPANSEPHTHRKPSTLLIAGASLIAFSLLLTLLTAFWNPQFDASSQLEIKLSLYSKLIKTKMLFSMLSSPLLVSGILTCSMAVLGNALQRSIQSLKQ